MNKARCCKYKGCDRGKTAATMTISFRPSGREGRKGGVAALRPAITVSVCEAHLDPVIEQFKALFEEKPISENAQREKLRRAKVTA